MKLNTVNVIEYINGTVQAVHSFTDDPEGNKEAETLFIKTAKENGLVVDEDTLDDGYVDDGNYYALYITHALVDE